MCGVVGAVSAGPVEPGLVENMREQLVHRGPDAAGLWLSDDGRVCFGHRRLAIIDLSPEANQPFVSHDRRFVIVFNGEIYNFQSLRAELAARGAVFRTRSDTEVLLEAFRAWGPKCLSRLSGMFAFAIWDTEERRLFCARDRVGEKPFYYALVENSFIFASELKAIVQWPAFRRSIHYPALIDFLCLGFVADPKSIWEGCYKLPPAHWMLVQLEEGRSPRVSMPTAYWDMEFAPERAVTDWGPAILESLERSSKEMVCADVPVGAFLSGGVDSSSVTAALSRADCKVNTFTIGFPEPEYDERNWAQQVARRYGTSHTESVVSADDLEPVFEKLLWHYDEPFNDYSYFPTFYLCREARKHITVALSGDGGDELFAGYLKYQRLGRREELQRFVPRPVFRMASGTANRLLSETSPLRRTFAQHGCEPSDMLIDMFITGFPIGVLRQAAHGPLADALKHYTPADAILPLVRKASLQHAGLINCMRYLDLKLTLAGDILVKVDRASMAVSLEVRPVYLHHDMLSLAARIPAERLADKSHSKEALKSALRSWLPEDLLYRRKMGFAMPLKKWFRTDLRQIFKNNGKSPVSEWLDASLCEQLIAKHASGAADLTAVLHSIFFLNGWLARWS